MTVARIPFSPAQEDSLTMLSRWMLFLVIVHGLLAALFLLGGCLGMVGSFAMFSRSPAGGALQVLNMLIVVLLGGAAGVEVGLLFQTKTELDAVVKIDDADQAHLSTAFTKLKFFFMLEMVFGLGSILINLIGVLLAAVAPELVGGRGMGGGL